MLEDIAARFKGLAPGADWWSLRLVDDTAQALAVRQDVPQPIHNARSIGAHVTLARGGGVGYGATSDVTPAGLKAAAERAVAWAQRTGEMALIDSARLPRSTQRGAYETPGARRWKDSGGLGERMDLLQSASRALHADDAIVDWTATLTHRQTETLLIASSGAEMSQRLSYLAPALSAAANRGAETQQRTFGLDQDKQGGLERLERLDLSGEATRVAEEALALLAAPACPNGRMDVLLMPGQMILQIHESIGHPLELDRILGDERNYAGTSFVTLDMFGQYRYGSELLNVTFDPSSPEELASYAFDDEGTAAERAYLIRNGILERPLGGALSQARAGLAGVANARACHWNRPPIDRMANINLEPGDSTLEALIGGIEHGVLMDTNRSWSIDDARNKFQFGCEYGRLIEDGRLQGLVKNPSYRGVSTAFWRNLVGVGDVSTRAVMGVPTCGKGEPNQGIHAGHASPVCVFKKVDVFGGA